MLKLFRVRQADGGLSSRFLCPVACAAAVLFALAGCGGGGNDTSATQLSSLQANLNTATAEPGTLPVAVQAETRTSISPAPVMEAVDMTDAATPILPALPEKATMKLSTTSVTSMSAAGKLITFYGDATMRGAESFNPSVQAPITESQAMIADLPVGAYAADNEGVNASHVDELLIGADGLHAAWDAEMANSKADIVIINHGSPFQPSLDVYKASLHALAMKARAAGKLVIFQTPNPTQDGRAVMDPVVAAMKEQALADQVPVIDVYEYLYGYIAQRVETVNDIIPDGYHPSDSTYVLIGKYAASVFKTIVQ